MSVEVQQAVAAGDRPMSWAPAPRPGPTGTLVRGSGYRDLRDIPFELNQRGPQVDNQTPLSGITASGSIDPTVRALQEPTAARGCAPVSSRRPAPVLTVADDRAVASRGPIPHLARSVAGRSMVSSGRGGTQGVDPTIVVEIGTRLACGHVPGRSPTGT